MQFSGKPCMNAVRCNTTFIVLFVFIHFYGASHSMSLSEALPTTANDTVSEFTRRSAKGNCK